MRQWSKRIFDRFQTTGLVGKARIVLHEGDEPGARDSVAHARPD